MESVILDVAVQKTGSNSYKITGINRVNGVPVDFYEPGMNMSLVRSPEYDTFEYSTPGEQNTAKKHNARKHQPEHLAHKSKNSKTSHNYRKKGGAHLAPKSRNSHLNKTAAIAFPLALAGIIGGLTASVVRPQTETAPRYGYVENDLAYNTGDMQFIFEKIGDTTEAVVFPDFEEDIEKSDNAENARSNNSEYTLYVPHTAKNLDMDIKNGISDGYDKYNYGKQGIYAEDISNSDASSDDGTMSEIDDIQFEEYSEYMDDAQYWLEVFERCGGDAWQYFDRMCETLGKSRLDTMALLCKLSFSEDWGFGVTNPALLCAQIMRESSYDSAATGDGGRALGWGQFHGCAVDEVNKQYGTNYAYFDCVDGTSNRYYSGSDDRLNPERTLEMMVLLLKYDMECTGSIEGMLAMYNRGNAGGINTPEGQAYVQSVFDKLDHLPL